MFFSIPVAHNSRKFFNFCFDGEVFTHNRLPMGVSISSWVGQHVTNISYSDVNFVNFLKMKGPIRTKRTRLKRTKILRRIKKLLGII